MSIFNKAKLALNNEKGATLVEYMILVGLVAIVGIIAWRTFGGKVSDKIGAQGDTINQLSS